MVKEAVVALERLMKEERVILAAPLPSEESPEVLSLDDRLAHCRVQGEQAINDLLQQLSRQKGEMGQKERDLLNDLLRKQQEHRALFIERLDQVSEKLKAVRKEKKALLGYRPGQGKDALFIDKKG